MLINEKITVKGKTWNTETFLTDAVVQFNERVKKRDIKTQKLTPKNLDTLAKDFHEETDDPEKLYSVLETFYTIPNQQLSDFFSLQRQYGSKSPCNLIAPAFAKTQDVTEDKLNAMLKELAAPGEKATGVPFHHAALLGDTKINAAITLAQDKYIGGTTTKRELCGTQTYPYLYCIGIGIPRLGWGFSGVTNPNYPGTCHFHHREFKYPIKSIIVYTPAAAAMIACHNLSGRIYGQDYALSYRPVWAFLFFGPVPFPHLTAKVCTKKR